MCAHVVYATIFYIHADFNKKLYEYANANAASAAFSICLLFFPKVSGIFFRISFHCFFDFFVFCFFVRHVNLESIGQKIMYTALCVCVYGLSVCVCVWRMRAIKYLTHEILNKLNFLPKNHNKHAA